LQNARAPLPRILEFFKEAVERIGGCRIYRNSLPHGVDCFFDIDRRFGRAAIEVVFDVGANIGQSALTYSREFPKAEIYSFEPVSATYSILAAQTKSLPRVHCFHLGMGPEAGQSVIHVASDSRKSSMLLERPEDHSETVAVETIAGFARKQGLKRIDFLKVDTEGFDLKVLEGAAPLLRRRQVGFIQIECQPMHRPADEHSFVDFHSLVEFLGGFGYQLFGVYEQQPEWDGRNRIMFWNAIFIGEQLVPAGSRL
jgi:FkbM family methyltransferase